jgi:hypothetical protein
MVGWRFPAWTRNVATERGHSLKSGFADHKREEGEWLECRATFVHCGLGASGRTAVGEGAPRRLESELMFRWRID